VHLVGFTTDLCYDAQSYKRQISYYTVAVRNLIRLNFLQLLQSTEIHSFGEVPDYIFLSTLKVLRSKICKTVLIF